MSEANPKSQAPNPKLQRRTKKKKLPAVVRGLSAASRRGYCQLYKVFLREVKEQDALYSIEVGNKRLSKRTYFETIAHNLALLSVWNAEEKKA